MSKKAASADPLSQLGYGIVAYTSIMEKFIWVFLLFTLLLVPTMMSFKGGSAYGEDSLAGYATGMISNLGYSSVQCHATPFSLGQVELSCPYGTVGEIYDYGVNSKDSGGPIDACLTNEYNSGCKPDSETIANMLKETIGKESSNIVFTDSELYSQAPMQHCIEESNRFFVQYSCIQSEEQQSEKYNALVVNVSATSLISLLFVIALNWMYRGGKI